MTARQTLYVQAMHGGIVVVVVLAAAVLAYNGTLDSATVATIFGAAVALAGGSAQTLGSLGTAVNGKATLPTSELANREATLRTAIAGAAGAPAHTVRPAAVPPEGGES